MPEIKLKQLQYEVESWQRVLRLITEENIHLKSRLSEAIQDNFDKKRLIAVEEFQTNFLKADGLIVLLRNELAELETLLVREMFEDRGMVTEITRKFKNIGTNISAAETDFIKMKSAFNNYLSQNVDV